MKNFKGGFKKVYPQPPLLGFFLEQLNGTVAKKLDYPVSSSSPRSVVTQEEGIKKIKLTSSKLFSLSVTQLVKSQLFKNKVSKKTQAQAGKQKCILSLYRQIQILFYRYYSNLQILYILKVLPISPPVRTLQFISSTLAKLDSYSQTYTGNIAMPKSLGTTLYVTRA